MGNIRWRVWGFAVALAAFLSESPPRYDKGMEHCVLMLEDNRERLDRFAAVLMACAPACKFLHWRNAHRMIRECPPYLASCRLICLDHDLDCVAGESDPGDGLDVARYLAPLQPSCPIVIHSSNGDRATRMLGEFQLHECRVQAILPLGPDWIENFWRQRVERLLQ